MQEVKEEKVALSSMEKNFAFTITKKVWRNTITFWVANVSSISRKTAISKLRWYYIVDKIHKETPDFVSLIETNITDNIDFRVPGYDIFTAELTNDRGILILIRSELKGIQHSHLLNIGLSIKVEKLKCTIITGYCPTYKERIVLSEFIHSNTLSGNYIVVGDWEENNIKFMKKNKCNWIQPDYSRIINNKKYCTEAAWSSWKINSLSRRDKISDHFLLEGKITTIYQVKIVLNMEIDKTAILNKIFCNTKRKNKWLINWPYLSTREIFSRIKFLKERKTKIYTNDVNLNSICKGEADRIIREKYLLFKEKVLEFAQKGGKYLAKSFRMLFKNVKRKENIKIEGITKSKDIIIKGVKADLAIIEYFKNLYFDQQHINIANFNPTTSKPQFHIHIEKWEIDEVFEKLGMHKAISSDFFPDEALFDDSIYNKVRSAAMHMISSCKIPSHIKRGRLIPIAKSEEKKYPSLDNLRPIITLSPVYKIIELWLDSKIKEMIWRNINHWQVGFKSQMETLVNVYRVRKSIEKNRLRKRPIYLTFIDVKKAYDSLNRQKIYETLLKIGIPKIYVDLYIELTSDMIIEYKGHEIKYNKGVPQGSVLSPTIFALEYENALNILKNECRELYAFADDVVTLNYNNILVKQQKAAFKTWKDQENLTVHDTKTVVMFIGPHSKRKEDVGFALVDNYKYLGININIKDSKRNSHKRLREYVKALVCKTNLFRKYLDIKYHRIAMFYYILCKVEYYAAVEMALDWITAKDVESTTIKEIKLRLGMGKNIPNNFIKTLYNWNMKETLKKRRQDVLYKCSLNDNSVPEQFIKLRKIDDKNSKFPLNIISSCKQVYNSLTQSWWNSKDKCKFKCKICNEFVNLTSACLHISSNLTLSEKQWVSNVRKKWKIILYENDSDKTSKLLDKCVKEKSRIIKELMMSERRA